MHILTGLIRKAPFVKSGSNSKGEWMMFSIEMSESWKDRDGNRVYSNYKAVLFASTPGSINYNKEVLVEGAIVSISSETLQVVSREHNGKTYTHLEMINPKLVFAKAPEGAAPQQQAAQQQRAPQQSQQSAPPVDYDDSIPF